MTRTTRNRASAHFTPSRLLRKLALDRRGNTYFLVAAAIVPMIGMVGSGVDVGRAYMAKSRLQQACDSGVLAGRRAMTGGIYSNANKSEAAKMFNFNFQSGTYGSTGINFTSTQDGPSNVNGTASASLPTALMHIFGVNNMSLSVSCTAKLEISNVDVMLVLDVTGSMGSTNSGDSQTRLQGLKTATMNFFDTLTGAEIGDGRLRFGVVSYNHNVNVGGLILAKNPNWIDDNLLIPSRTPLYENWTYGPGTNSYGTPVDEDPFGTSGGWGNMGGGHAPNRSACEALTPPPHSAPWTSGGVSSTQTNQYISGDNRITEYSDRQEMRRYRYRYRWTSRQCRLERQQQRFYRYTPRTLTEPRVPAFSRYRYENRVFDISAAKSGGGVTADTGTNGADYTGWADGCIIEADTNAFAANQTAPANTHDMNIDLIPGANPATKWKLMVPGLTHVRGGPNTEWSTSDYGRVTSNRCPPPAMKLTPLTASDRAGFNTYIQALTANGNTYHDAGMIWGARLLSPTGILGDENITAPNGRPIQRHLIFMTDGALVPQNGLLTFQNVERIMRRVGNTDLTNRHLNRFSQICEATKAKNITVWTVAFGTSKTTQLTACASPGNDFLASNNALLNSQFQAIAQKISRLRLDQ